MAATATITYGTSTALTATLASLASDATNMIAGRQSTVIDNTADLAVDAIVGGKVTTGTTPTTGKQIEIWAFGSYDGTSFSAGAGASDANFSPTGAKTQMRLLTMIPTDATSNHTYTWGPFSVAQAFGGAMPKKWGIFIVHNTGVVLNATAGNHEIKYTPIKYTSA
jgi:hypothetical protein